jgi:hypothetical protein
LLGTSLARNDTADNEEKQSRAFHDLAPMRLAISNAGDLPLFQMSVA